MNNFELIDDYLSNRLRGEAKEGFERQLQNDPALKSDFEFQKQIVEGIRTARASELKAMLNNVPVGGGIVIDFQVARLAAGLITAGVVGAALYFYVSNGQMPPFNKAAGDITTPTEQVKPTTEPETPKQDHAQPQQTPDDKSTPAVTTETKKKEEKKKEEVVTPVERPKIDVANPSEELSESKPATSPVAAMTTKVTPSHVEVLMDSSNKKYDFHYQFHGSKLMLFGSFDKSLYQVLEINGDNHAVFLFYKDAYYALDEKQEKITKLVAIKDAALLKALKEYKDK